MKHQLILGYSPNLLAMLFEILYQQGTRGPFTIWKNVETADNPAIPYLPEGVDMTLIEPGSPFVLPPEFETSFGVYTPWVKEKVFHYFSGKPISESHYRNAIHPASVIASTASLQTGLHIEAHVTVAAFASLAFGVSLNRNCSIGHHTQIGRYVSIGPGVHIGGHSRLMDGVQVGIGASVFNDVTIGANSIIGGGSVVTTDIPDHVVAWGNPCKVIRPVTKH